MVAFPTDENQWHHVKHVKDGNFFSFFFDGQLIYTYELPISIRGGHLVLRTSPGTNQIDNLIVTTPEPEPVEIDLGLRRFKIRKDKVTGRTVLTLKGLPDLSGLNLSHGDRVGAIITIQLFDVFPDERDLIISGAEPALRVRDTEDVLVIRKPRF
jgi:hypothetical protein